MGKKHKHPEHENLERWLVSYADFITLLFATFTALFAIAQDDLSKMQKVSQEIQRSFKEQSLMSGLKSVIDGQGSSEDSAITEQHGEGDGVLGDYKQLTYTPGEVESEEKMAEELYHAIEQLNEEIAEDAKNLQEAAGKNPDGSSNIDPDAEENGIPKGLTLTIQERGLKVSMDSRLLFGAGSAALLPESQKALDLISSKLRQASQNHLIEVEGHTDSQAISTVVYPSNWELSGARASSVVRYLVRKHKFSPKHLSAVGYADSRPLASNATPEGRAKNRRIDIIINSLNSTKMSDPTDQLSKEKTLISPTQSLTEPPKGNKEPQPVYSNDHAPGFVPIRQGEFMPPKPKEDDVLLHAEDG